MGCFTFLAKRKDRIVAKADRRNKVTFYASLICLVVLDVMKYYFVSSDDKYLCDKEGRQFVGKEFQN